MFIEILDCSFAECYVASILKWFPYEIRNILRFMLCQEIQNILSLDITFKIKDLPALNKVIWMACPACSSMGYQPYWPAMVIVCSASPSLHFRLQVFLTLFASFSFLHMHTTAWFQNITESFTVLMNSPVITESTQRHLCCIAAWQHQEGPLLGRGLNCISSLDTDCQIYNFSKMKNYQRFR